jgi:probable HAF family extracellular repeat protein
MSAVSTGAYRTVSCLAAAALAAGGAPAPAAAAPGVPDPPVSCAYRVVELDPPDGAEVTARALNDRGQVVGALRTPDGALYPFRWQGGVLTELPVLEPAPDGWGLARDVNIHGDVVGGSDAGGVQHAVLWRQGRAIDLGAGFATAINDRGQVVGTRSTAGGELRGFIWERGRTRDLGIAGPTEPLDINERGEVVGWSGAGAEPDQRAFLWRDGTVSWLPSTGRWSRANAINERGEMVGTTSVDDGEPVSRAVRWQRDGTMTWLGTLPGGNASGAAAVNDHGLIVGSGNLVPYGLAEHAFRYRSGVLVDLFPLGVPAEAAHSLQGLDNRGRILTATRLYVPSRWRVCG